LLGKGIFSRATFGYPQSPEIDKIVAWVETCEGDHTNKIPERIETRALPFFSTNLAFKKVR
jgi:hypothetical protein